MHEENVHGASSLVANHPRGIERAGVPKDKIATHEMLDFLVETKGLSRENAYMLASATVDLVVTQVVDGTNGIHAMMPKGIFRKMSTSVPSGGRARVQVTVTLVTLSGGGVPGIEGRRAVSGRSDRSSGIPTREHALGKPSRAT